MLRGTLMRKWKQKGKYDFQQLRKEHKHITMIINENILLKHDNLLLSLT